MTEGRSIALWTKYLPAIRILLKKAVTEEQQITLNKIDLQAVDNRKNANFSFNLEISNGKVETAIGMPPLGKDLFKVLSDDRLVKAFMLDKKIMINMTRSTVLSFRCN
jgi:hypothetical protein